VHLENVTEIIIGAAIVVHRALGPGLLESTYQACLYAELVSAGLHVEREKVMPLRYRGERIECAYRADLVVNRSVIVEVKSVERLDPVHAAQLRTYLKLSECKVGLLINFNSMLLRHGLKRVSVGTSDTSPDLAVELDI
jgi:GxxExxY protein